MRYHFVSTHQIRVFVVHVEQIRDEPLPFGELIFGLAMPGWYG
jgi:hypothetical protein